MLKALNFKYKGDRHYIHGTDFFTQIDRVLAPEHGGHLQKLVFKSFARNNCSLSLERPENNAPVGHGSWRDRDGTVFPFWVLETSSKIDGREEFDEDLICGPASIVGKTIHGVANNPYPAIDNIVALTKRLNYYISPDINGKWVFGQINLDRPIPDRFGAITIEQISEPSRKFSRNRIAVDNAVIGEIRFIVGKP